MPLSCHHMTALTQSLGYQGMGILLCFPEATKAVEKQQMLKDYQVLPGDRRKVAPTSSVQARALQMCDSDFLSQRAKQLSADLGA